MVVEISVRVLSKQAQASLREFQKEHRNAMFQAFLAGARRALSAAKSSAPRDTGELARSLKVRQRKRDLIASVGSDLRYAPSVELGTGVEYTGNRRQRANSRWNNRPPKISDSLRDWSARRGLEVYAVQHVLQRNQGTKARPHIRPAIEQQRTRVERDVLKGVIRSARKARLETRATQ